MPLPAGITTCTVTIGPEIRILGSGAVISGAISADRRLVWAATGATIYNLPEEIPTTSPGGSVSFQVPHVDQPGFTDPNGGAITNWAYTFVGQVRFEGSQSVPVRKSFQVFVGQTEVDLDLVPEGPTLPAVVAPSSADRALEAAAEAEQSALDAEDSAIQAAASAAAASGAAAAQAAAEAAQAGAETAQEAAETARAAAEAARDGSVDAETAAETAQAAAETASASATSSQAAAETARDAALAAQTGAETAQTAAAGSATAAATSESNTTNAISNRFGATQPVLATNYINNARIVSGVEFPFNATGTPEVLTEGGESFLRHTSTISNSTGNLAVPAASSNMPISGTTTVQARMQIRGNGSGIGKTVQVRVWTFIGAATGAIVGSQDLTLTDQWQDVLITTSTAATPTADGVRLYVAAASPWTTADKWDIRRPYLGVPTQAWFHGDSPGARWTGARDASDSELVLLRTEDTTLAHEAKADPHAVYQLKTRMAVLATNLFPNPSAEFNGGFISNNTAQYLATRDTATVYHGATSIRVEKIAGITTSSMSLAYVGCTGGSSTNRTPVAENRTYVLTCWMRAGQSNTRGRLYGVFYNASAASVGTIYGSWTGELPVGTWTRVVGVVVAPAGSVNFTPGFEGGGTTGTGTQTFPDGSFYHVDAFTMTEGSAVPADYFDGSMTGVRWTGTANQSTSERVQQSTADVARQLTSDPITTAGAWERKPGAWLYSTLAGSPSSGTTGALQVEWDVSPNGFDTMINVELDVYGYGTGGFIRTRIDASNYAQTTGSHVGPHARVSSAQNFSSTITQGFPTIRWNRSADKTKLRLLVGDYAGVQPYLNAQVLRVTSIYGATSILGGPRLSVVTTSPDGTTAASLVVDDFGVFRGAGSPEALVAANVGARYIDTAATNGAIEWVKASGASTTGWRVVYGDTGWRTVTSLLINGWTSSEVFRLRRVGADVTLHGVFVKTNATSDTFGVPPTGFRPGQVSEAFYAAAGAGSGGGAALFETKLAHWKLYRAGFTTSAYLTVTYLTDDAWPSTLPGT